MATDVNADVDVKRLNEIFSYLDKAAKVIYNHRLVKLMGWWEGYPLSALAIHMARLHALPNHFVDHEGSSVTVYTADGRPVCRVDLASGDSSGRCDGIDYGTLATVAVNLANGYYTAIAVLATVMDMDSEVSEVFERLASIGAAMDPELYDKLTRLAEAMKIQVFRAPANVYVPWSCVLSSKDAIIMNGRLRFRYSDAEGLTIRLRNLNRVLVEVIYVPDMSLVIVRPDFVFGTPPLTPEPLDVDVDLAVHLLRNWRNIALGVLKKVRFGRCAETAKAWASILENLGEKEHEAP